MDEVLVDGSEIRGQDLIQDVDDALFRFHGLSPFLSLSALKGAFVHDAITAIWLPINHYHHVWSLRQLVRSSLLEFDFHH
jgi:hypothetical protein